MVTGKVKNWLTSFGFITGDDGKEYFVHTSDAPGGSLSAGQKVEFESESGPKGLKAKKVKLAGNAAPSGESPAKEEAVEAKPEEEAPAEEAESEEKVESESA